jgi:hypothetical protein
LLLGALIQDNRLRRLALYCSVSSDQLVNGWHGVSSLKKVILYASNGIRWGSVAQRFLSTRGGTRTHTPLRALDFESSASANSATLAYGLFRRPAEWILRNGIFRPIFTRKLNRIAGFATSPDCRLRRFLSVRMLVFVKM